MLIELAMGIGIAALYWWEIVARALNLPPEANIGTFGSTDWNTIAHAQFASHVVLIAFMAVATFIDLDEMLIPDTVTIPGTLIGLLLAFLYPWSLLPGLCWIPAGAVNSEREFLQINSPNAWPAALSNAEGTVALWIALGCWWGWCFAILPRRWLARRGLFVALRILARRMVRESFTWLVAGLGAIGSLLLLTAWSFSGPAAWAGLLTALVGMAIAGGWTWLVRIVCSQAIGREAMGFGDVTLMAMIGVFLGWQAALITFFLAPITGALMGVAMWLVHRSRVLPFGPYLCLGALVVVIFWRDIWQFSAFHFSLGWLIPAVLVVGIVLMGVLLAAWRAILAMLVPLETDGST
jgi:prepilin signal peptidase PulO-like enzyme (type II secretory pathway)